MKTSLERLPPIGMQEAQACYGLTARALRFYEQQGLVEARRDPWNCRIFDAEARRRLAWISALRQAGIPISAVRDVLDAEDWRGGGVATALKALGERRQQLLDEIGKVDALVRSMTIEAISLGSAA